MLSAVYFIVIIHTSCWMGTGRGVFDFQFSDCGCVSKIVMCV